MTIEFGIIDDQGVLFGLPARTFESIEAAKNIFDFLVQRRADMKRAANDAQTELQLGVKEADRHRLQDVVEVWAREKDRRFTIVRREVSDWEPAAGR